MAGFDPRPSEALGAALATYGTFLVSDDAERERRIEASDPTVLQGLAQAVAPLFDEINALLDDFDAAAHPLPDDLARLESNLHSLAQAGIEAAMHLEEAKPTFD